MHILGPLSLILAIEREGLTLGGLAVIGACSLLVGLIVRIVARAMLGEED